MANRISRITSFVEKHKLGFGVARLIMMSGVNVAALARMTRTRRTPSGDSSRHCPNCCRRRRLLELQNLLSEA